MGSSNRVGVEWGMLGDGVYSKKGVEPSIIMNIRQSLSQIIEVHPNLQRDLEDQRNTQLHILITKVQSTFTLLNQQMSINPDIQDFDVDCKDPSLILDLIVKMFSLCNANIRQNGLNSFDKLVQRLIKMIRMEDQDKVLQNSAKMAIEIFDLKKKSVHLQHQTLIINQKLKASEDAYKTIITKATTIIQSMKQEFSKLLSLLKDNEDLMLKLEGNNKRLSEEKSQLQVFIKDYKENIRNRKDPEVRRNRERSVLKKKYQEGLEEMERQYRYWWGHLDKGRKG